MVPFLVKQGKYIVTFQLCSVRDKVIYQTAVVYLLISIEASSSSDAGILVVL